MKETTCDMCGKEGEVVGIPQLGYKVCEQCQDELKEYIEEYRRRLDEQQEDK